MNSKDWLERRKHELLNRLRALDPETVQELEGVIRAIQAFDPSLTSHGEFAGVDNLTAVEKYLIRAGKATIDEAAEAMWSGGMRPPESVYAEGKVSTERQAKEWVVWRFKQAIGRHIKSARQPRIRLEKGFLVLTAKKD